MKHLKCIKCGSLNIVPMATFLSAANQKRNVSEDWLSCLDCDTQFLGERQLFLPGFDTETLPPVWRHWA